MEGERQAQRFAFSPRDVDKDCVDARSLRDSPLGAWTPPAVSKQRRGKQVLLRGVVVEGRREVHRGLLGVKGNPLRFGGIDESLVQGLMSSRESCGAGTTSRLTTTKGPLVMAWETLPSLWWK